MEPLLERAVLDSGPGPAQVHAWCTVQLRLQESSTSGRGAGEPSRPELGAKCRVWGRAGDSLLGAGREESGKEGTFQQWMGNLKCFVRETEGEGTRWVMKPVGAHPAGCLGRGVGMGAGRTRLGM